MPHLAPWQWYQVGADAAHLVLLLFVLLAVMVRRRAERDADIEELHGRVDLVAGKVGAELRHAAAEPVRWQPPVTTTGPLVKPTAVMRTEEIEAARAEAERLAAESRPHPPEDS